MEHVEKDQYIILPSEKQKCQSVCENIEEGSIENTNYSCSIEDIKKYQSDNSLIMSDSSEGNSSEFDSTTAEKHSKRKFANPRKTSRTLLETDFPKYPRSKSNVLKKTYQIEDVVNEEMIEDDCDSMYPIRRKKLINVNINYTDEIPVLSRLKLEEVRSAKSLQLDTVPKFTSDFGRISIGISSIAPTMAPVPESQEDEKPDLKSNILLQSPRIKIPSDFKEDACIASGSPRTTYFALGYHLGIKNYSIDNEAIAEDNNENIVEKEGRAQHPKKKDSISKFETFIDKEEPPNIDAKCEVEEGEEFKFETINEENAEEDVVNERNINISIRNLSGLDNICADEVDVGVEKTNAISMIIKAGISAEEAINELDGEDEK